MKAYELSVVLHPDLEIDLDTPLKKIKKIITDNGGKVLKEEPQGKKRLAYRINKQDYGVYVYLDLELPPEAAQKIDAILNITDESLRHLLVAVNEKEKAWLAESKTKRDERQEEGEE